MTSGCCWRRNAWSSLDEIALVVAQRYDGTRSLAQIAQELAGEFDADAADIEIDVIELTATLHQKRLLRL